MRSKAVVVIVVAFVLFYSLTLLVMGIGFLAAGGWGILLGLGLIGILLLSIGLTVREVRFGVASERLAREIQERDGVPLSTLPRDEQGRIDPVLADAEWQRRKALAEATPDDWRVWFLLGIAYDEARDRKQARAAIRKAIALRKAAP